MINNMKQQTNEEAERIDPAAVKTHVDQYREGLLKDSILTESLAFHAHINKKYKKELDSLAQRIKEDMIEGSPDMADKLRKLDISVDLTVIAKERA